MRSRCFGLLTGIALAAAMVLEAHTALADTTIRMWTFLDPAGQSGREKVLKELIGNFEAAHPGVKIEVEPQAWQQLTDKFFAADQTGTAPDVVWIRSDRVFEAVNLGVFANLDELFDWTSEDIADIDGPHWRYGATADGHFQFMFSRFVTGAFYRKDLFRQAGIDADSLTTWDKFIDAAQKLTEKDANGNVVRWGYLQAFPTDGANLPIMGNVMLDLQGRMFGDEGAAAWATDAGVRGMNLQLDFIRKYGVAPDVAMSMNDEDMYDAFNAGRAAMIHGGINRLPAAQEKLGAENVGYLRTPSFTEGKYSPAETGGWASGVWAKSQNLEMAGKWLEYMASREADKLWVTEAGMVPLRQSTIDSNPQFFARPDKDYLVTAFEELKTAWLPPEGVAGGFNDDLDRAAQQVFVNGADPKEALENAEKAYDRRR